MRQETLNLLLAASLLSLTPSTRAGLSFAFTPATQLGARSNLVVFSGTLSNTSLTDDLYLNDIQFSFDGVATNYLAGDSNAFFANVPGILSPGETYSDVVCIITIDATTLPGDYSGSVTIFGGADIFAAANLGMQTIQVSVFDTPFDLWQFQQFGANTNNPAISGPLADPDSDGLVNLLEYAFSLNPNSPDETGLLTPQIDPNCDCLTLTYTKVLGATDLTYTPEVAADPGGPWSTNGVAEIVTDANTTAQKIRVSDIGFPVTSATNRFIRLRVTSFP
ncbi:MAG TPA: hypothetical protein VL171_09335 [Verrucomicrobiae bacterium]|nr:hypothetical protein [Verrucomicrobiae bacterium]